MAGKKATTAQRNQEIIQMASSGDYSYSMIAENFGLTRSRVYQIIQEWDKANDDDVKYRYRNKKDDAKRKVLNTAKEENLTYAEIAERFGKTQMYWRSSAKKLGMEDCVAKVHSRTVKRNGEIMEYLKQGHTQAQAAEKFGLCQPAISGIALGSGSRKRLTGELLEKRNAELINDAKRGMKASEMCKKYGVSAACVYNILRDAGVKIKKTPKSKKPKKKMSRKAKNAKRDSKIVKDYKRGKTYEELAAKYSVSVSTVYKVIKDAGVIGSGNPKGRRKAQKSSKVSARNKAIVKGYINNKTYEELAKEYHVSVSTVYNAIKADGVVGQGNPRGRQPLLKR